MKTLTRAKMRVPLSRDEALARLRPRSASNTQRSGVAPAKPLTTDARAIIADAEQGNLGRLQERLEAGQSLFVVDPRTGDTPLHAAASAAARGSILLMAILPGCDFLARDGEGRLPSELALEFGDDPVLARYLSMRENTQADRAGVPILRRPSSTSLSADHSRSAKRPRKKP